jgi:hypothetical protein
MPTPIALAIFRSFWLAAGIGMVTTWNSMKTKTRPWPIYSSPSCREWGWKPTALPAARAPCQFPRTDLRNHPARGWGNSRTIQADRQADLRSSRTAMPWSLFTPWVHFMNPSTRKSPRSPRRCPKAGYWCQGRFWSQSRDLHPTDRQKADCSR